MITRADALFDAAYPTVDDFFLAVMTTMCHELGVEKVHLTITESQIVEYGFSTKTGAIDTAYQLVDDRKTI